MKIAESHKTEHEILCLHFDVTQKIHEKWVDIARNEQGKIMSVTIDDKEITAFDLEILNFLKKEGKID